MACLTTSAIMEQPHAFAICTHQVCYGQGRSAAVCCNAFHSCKKCALFINRIIVMAHGFTEQSDNAATIRICRPARLQPCWSQGCGSNCYTADMLWWHLLAQPLHACSITQFATACCADIHRISEACISHFSHVTVDTPWPCHKLQILTSRKATPSLKQHYNTFCKATRLVC